MTVVTTALGYLAAVVFLAEALFLILTQHLVAGGGARRPFDGLVRHLCRSCLLVFGIRISVSGRHRIDPERTYLFMANHVSLFDPLVLFGSIRNNVRGVELEDHFSWPLWGAIARWIGNIPISHRDLFGALSSLERAEEALRRGVSVIILPEGHRTRDGSLRHFMRGPFRLALRAGVEIVPMAITGLYERKSVHSRLVRPGTIRVRFGRPIEFGSFATCTERALRELVRREIEGLLSDEADLAAALDALRDPSDRILDWEEVRSALLHSDKE